MELKRRLREIFQLEETVLIVPYGIETNAKLCKTHAASIVLIVPYGIETHKKRFRCSMFNNVLIVPYGIETSEKRSAHSFLLVLIVPYGIETTMNIFELLIQKMC